MQYHPDRNPGDKVAEEKFKEASDAYAILSDENKRKMYDQYGYRGVEEGGGGSWLGKPTKSPGGALRSNSGRPVRWRLLRPLHGCTAVVSLRCWVSTKLDEDALKHRRDWRQKEKDGERRKTQKKNWGGSRRGRRTHRQTSHRLKDTLSKKSVRTGQRTRGAKHKYRQVKTNHF